jgi:restriction modification system DNA specificity protein
MSKIDELLKNEKVEWKKLSEIATLTGAGVDKKKKWGESPIKLLNYMDVYKNQYINSNIPEMYVTAPDNKIKNCNIECGDIFVTPSSETTDDIFRTAVATEDVLNTVYSYHIMRIRLKTKSFITSCYLNYLFQSETFRRDLYKRVFGNTRKTIAKSEIEQIEIPIPSIEVQEKIVKTLDNFTNYVTELQDELQARIKQYEYYREKLLDFKK